MNTGGSSRRKPNLPSKSKSANSRVRLYVGPQSRFNKKEIYESQEKPKNRNEKAGLTVRGTTGSGKESQYNIAAGESSPARQSIQQKNTMWVAPLKDPKTGKVIRKGYLAYRNAYHRGHIKDKSLYAATNPGQLRRIRRGDPVTGTVQIPNRGTTYLYQDAVEYRGGTDSTYWNSGLKPIARYVGGKNVNSPSMRKKLSFSAADRTEQAKIAKRKLKKK